MPGDHCRAHKKGIVPIPDKLKLVTYLGRPIWLMVECGEDPDIDALKIGGGWSKVVEHQELTISRWYEIQWRRQEIDLTELAKRRWIDKWSIERLAENFGFGTTRIKFFLNQIKENPDLVDLEMGRSKKRPWAIGRVFRGK